MLDVLGAVNCHDHIAMLSQVDQPSHLRLPHNLVCYKHVPDARLDHRLCLPELGAGDSYRPRLDLLVGYDGALVRLLVGPELRGQGLEEPRHRVDVPLKLIQIDEKRRRIQLRLIVANLYHEISDTLTRVLLIGFTRRTNDSTNPLISLSFFDPGVMAFHACVSFNRPVLLHARMLPLCGEDGPVGIVAIAIGAGLGHRLIIQSIGIHDVNRFRG